MNIPPRDTYLASRLAGVEPLEYLTDVLTVLSRGIKRVDPTPQLMPAAWARRRASSEDGSGPPSRSTATA